MEREFLMGVDFALYVSGKKYESWLNLLKGLVLAKESESQKWRKSRTRYRHGRRLQPAASTPVMRTTYSRCHSTTYRARSTSPVQYIRPPFTANLAVRPQLHVNPPPSPSPTPGSKRSAADAFSPTSTSFNELPPLKRPTGMTLHIPENGFPTGPSSSSPLEPLRSFAKMSLSASSSSPHNTRTTSSVHPLPAMHENRPQTLVAPYRADRPVNVPQVRCFQSPHRNILIFSSHFPRIFTTILWPGRPPIQKQNKNGCGERPVSGVSSHLLRQLRTHRLRRICPSTSSLLL